MIAERVTQPIPSRVTPPAARDGGTGGPARVPRQFGAVLRTLPLVLAGLVMEVGWIVVWALSYRLTHGNDFTYSYLVARDEVWLRLYDLLQIMDRLVPGIEPPTALDPLVNSLVAGFIMASVGYLAVLVLLDRGLVPPRPALGAILALTVLFQATLITMPGIYTSDIFSYMMYGQISSTYGLNPYLYPPSTFPANPLFGWIQPIWQSTPSVYGPLWTDLSWAFTRLIDGLSLTDQVFAYKALMNGVHLANLGLVWWLLGRLRPDGGSYRARVTAFAVFALNPLLLFEVVGNAHNDALMVLLMLLSIVPLAASRGLVRGRPATPGASAQRQDGRWIAATTLLTLSVLVKYTTGVLGLFYLVAWARRLPTARARLGWMGGATLVGMSVTLLLAWPWLRLPGVLGPMAEAFGGKNYTNSVPDLAALTVANQVLVPLGFSALAAQDTARFWTKLITKALFVAYLGWEARRLWRRAGRDDRRLVTDILEASVRALLVLVLGVLMWVLSWYYTWPLALASLLGWRNTLTRVVVAYTLFALPIFYIHQYWSVNMSGGFVLLYAFAPLGLPVGEWAWTRWCRRGASPPSSRRPRIVDSPGRRRGAAGAACNDAPRALTPPEARQTFWTKFRRAAGQAERSLEYPPARGTGTDAR